MAAQILVVEDDSAVATYLQHVLTSLGYQVAAIVASGAEAIHVATERQPDLVLMDIQLEGVMDGVEAADQIRQQCRRPVVYLTAHADEALLQRIKRTAPFGYLLKPFSPRELQIIIEVALDKHQMERQLAESARWLATVLQSLPDAVITTDSQGHITLLNPVAERLTGWTQDEAAGRDLPEILHLVDPPPVSSYESSAPLPGVVSKEGGLTDQWLLTKEGRTIPIDASATPIKDDHGQHLGVVVLVRDITARKQWEAERAHRVVEEHEALHHSRPSREHEPPAQR